MLIQIGEISNGNQLVLQDLLFVKVYEGRCDKYKDGLKKLQQKKVSYVRRKINGDCKIHPI